MRQFSVPTSTSFAKASVAGVLLTALLFPCIGHAYEADVHFGLTKWLAIKAGFDDGEAEAIALGDQRVDGGLIENTKSQLQYACLAPYSEDAMEVQALHYPSMVKVPAPAAQRVVKAGGEASIALAKTLVSSAEGKAGFMLQLFGRSLHPLQDSFAHQGTPATLPSDAVVVCDEKLSMNAVGDRRNAGSHPAELTMYAPETASTMAQVTYEYLIKYPRVEGHRRSPETWDAIAPELAQFTSGSTKSQKAVWFKSHGIGDTSFLDGTSLPDGTGWNPVRWGGKKMPVLGNSVSTQAGIDPGVLQFFNSFFSAWLTGSTAPDVLSHFTSSKVQSDPKTGRLARTPPASLVLKLLAWRLRDHGTAAMLLARLDAGDRKVASEIGAWAQKPTSTEHFVHISDAVLPILVEGYKPSPLLPFVIFQRSKANDTNEQAVAVVKLRDAPYETVGIVATRIGDRWQITGIRSTYDY